MRLAEKWKNFVVEMNQKGIPIPTVRDPKTQTGSVSFTMVAVSFGLMTACVLGGLALVVNKWAGFFTDEASALSVLKEAFFMAFQMAGLSSGLYWGRKFQRDEKGAVSVEGKAEKAE